MKTWTTPLGVKLTVSGRGGPWTAINGHGSTYKPQMTPLNIPIPGAGNAGFYYRNGWQLDAKRLDQVVGRRGDA